MRKTSLAISLALMCLTISSYTPAGSAVGSFRIFVEEAPSPCLQPEPTLQDWFISNGYTVNVTADETGLEIFEAGYYRVSVLAEFALYAPFNNVSFYFYHASDGKLGSILQGGHTTDESFFFWAEEDFGLCLGSPEGYFYTEALRNEDKKDHALVFEDPRADGYIVAWEDLWDLGDADYQDMILAALAPVEIDVCYRPRTLNLRSQGRWITCIIALPRELTISDIDMSSISLNETVPADTKISRGLDCENRFLVMVKFDRHAIVELVGTSHAGKGFGATRTEVTLILMGRFTDGTTFQGTSSVWVINPNCSIS